MSWQNITYFLSYTRTVKEKPRPGKSVLHNKREIFDVMITGGKWEGMVHCFLSSLPSLSLSFILPQNLNLTF
jgi:hypothetical protein